MFSHKNFLGILLTIVAVLTLALIGGQVWAQWTPPPGAPGDGGVIGPLTNPLQVDLNFEYPAGSKHSIINAQDGNFAGTVQSNTVRGTNLCIGLNCRTSWPVGEVTNPMTRDLDAGNFMIHTVRSCNPREPNEICSGLTTTADKNPLFRAYTFGLYASTESESQDNPSYAVYGASRNRNGVGIYGSDSAGGYAGYFNGSFGVSGNSSFIGNLDVSGKVGIGTAVPEVKLEVADATASIAQLRITDTAQNPELQLQYGAGADDHWGIYNDQTADELRFWANGSDRITFNQTGEVYAYAYIYSSDQSLKYNINTIYQPLEKIKQLRGVTFNWKETKEPSMGFVAQEVEKVLPALVKTNDQGLKSVAYGNLTAILVEAIKAQQAQIEQLQAEDNANFSQQKICSVLISGNSRDTLAVPNSWTGSACNDFRTDSGAAYYQMGCLASNGVTFGGNCTSDACTSYPSPNCGW